ncbi:uncharacterized protein PG986_009004 [Apiospora aurea]|uniref:Uncharacterized protein n=1 Tax=Apiospora aurea TaxID=335848 RepID=A0ABR1Q6N2_9PEZI
MFASCLSSPFSPSWNPGLGGLVSGCLADFEALEASNLLLRASMPILPYFKTESEAPSLCFARDQDIPNPEVYWYDASGENALGLNWMIWGPDHQLPQPHGASDQVAWSGQALG